MRYYSSFLKEFGFQLAGRISRVLVEKERRQSPSKRIALISEARNLEGFFCSLTL